MELINMTDHHGNDGRSLGSMVIGLGHGTGKLAHSMRMAQRVRHKYKNKQTISFTHSFIPSYKIFTGMKTKKVSLGWTVNGKQNQTSQRDMNKRQRGCTMILMSARLPADLHLVVTGCTKRWTSQLRKPHTSIVTYLLFFTLELFSIIDLWNYFAETLSTSLVVDLFTWNSW